MLKKEIMEEETETEETKKEDQKLVLNLALITEEEEEIGQRNMVNLAPLNTEINN